MKVWDDDNWRWIEDPPPQWVCEWVIHPRRGTTQRVVFDDSGKAQAIDKAKQVVRDGSACLGSAEVYRQVFNFVRKDSGGYDAQPETLVVISAQSL